MTEERDPNLHEGDTVVVVDEGQPKTDTDFVVTRVEPAEVVAKVGRVTLTK